MIIWTWIILFYHYFPFLFRRNALTFFKNLRRKRSGDPRRILPEVFRRPASAEGQAVNPFGRSGACPFSPMACLFDDSNPPVKQGQKRGICPGELRPPPPETSCRFRIRKTFGTASAAGGPFSSSSPLPLEEAFSRTRRRQPALPFPQTHPCPDICHSRPYCIRHSFAPAPFHGWTFSPNAYREGLLFKGAPNGTFWQDAFVLDLTPPFHGSSET